MQLCQGILVLFFALVTLLPERVSTQLHPDVPESYDTVPSLREQAAILDKWTAERVEYVPELMRKYGVDVWLMSQREYAEDTVFWSMKPSTTFAARRRTVYLFHTSNSSSSLTNPLLWIDNTPKVWSSLREIFVQLNPSKILLNIHPDFAFADGLHMGEWERMSEELGSEWMNKTVREPMVAIEFVARRIEAQKEKYTKLMQMAWTMVKKAFSEKVVNVGVTTADDLSWWFREEIQSLDVSTWNMPRVSIIRAPSLSSPPPTMASAIQEGDMLHVDFGLTFLGLNTDMQHLGYVLRVSEGETDVPQGLKDGLKKSNRMQELVRNTMKPGETGNNVLTQSLGKMADEGIQGQIYCHPIGDRGHAAGSLIGMNDLPYNVPILGDLPILPKTYYSVELLARHFVPEWNATIEFMQEENVAWSDESQGWEWVFGRQENFHIVKDERMGPALRVQ